MSLFLAAAILVGCTALTVALMLVVRRRAPAGGFFSDSDRASGAFGFIGAGYAIILGFVILITFQGYSNAKQKAGDEAGGVSNMFEAAGLFDEDSRTASLEAGIVCYARSVIHYEWDTMSNGEPSEITEGWVDRLDEEVAGADLNNAQDLAAIAEWNKANEKRSDGRRERLIESEEVLPTLMWAMLFLGAALLIGYVFLYADPEELLIAQAMMMGGVTALVVASLLVVSLLASPFQNEEGSILPSGMTYSLRLMNDDLDTAAKAILPKLCDDRGKPVLAGQQ